MKPFTFIATPMTHAITNALAQLCASDKSAQSDPSDPSDYAGEQHAPQAPHGLPIGDAALVNLPELLSLIYRIAKFQNKTFPNQTLQGKLNHLAKEARELADCAGRDSHEWADVLNLLIGAALLQGFTVADLARFGHDKMAICEQRQWPTTPGPDGCYHHVKEGQ